MNEFIELLKRRSSITCVSREQYGKVDLEFFSFDEVLDFSKQIARIVKGDMIWPELNVDDKAAWRRCYIMRELIKIFTEYLASDFQDIAMIAVDVPGEDGPQIEWRNRISWAFTSGNKAAELFQRLMWIME